MNLGVPAVLNAKSTAKGNGTTTKNSRIATQWPNVIDLQDSTGDLICFVIQSIKKTCQLKYSVP